MGKCDPVLNYAKLWKFIPVLGIIHDEPFKYVQGLK